MGRTELGQGALGLRTQNTLASVLGPPLADLRLDPSLALGKVSWGDSKAAQAWQKVREWVDLSCWAPARAGKQPPGGSS